MIISRVYLFIDNICNLIIVHDADDVSNSYLGSELLCMRALMSSNKRIAGTVCPNAIASRNHRIKRLETITNKEMIEKTSIKVNKVELKLFGFLREIAGQSACNVTLRVAGGWVRDKVLHQNLDHGLANKIVPLPYNSFWASILAISISHWTLSLGAILLNS